MITKRERFLKIPADDWKYELESGEISWDEHAVREWLWIKANPVTGIVVVNYKVLAEELKGRFSYVEEENLVNKITKIMISLKKKKKLWFKKHSGKKKKAINVELQDYPFINRGYKDISNRFQQSSGRAPTKISQNEALQAEVSETEKRLEESKTPENEQKSEPLDSDSGRGPKRESQDKDKERETDSSSSKLSDSPSLKKDELGEEKENSEAVIKEESDNVEYWGPDEVWKYFCSSVLDRKGIEPLALTEKAKSLIDQFLEKYGPEKATELIDYYLDSDECEKDREKMGINLSVIFGEIVIGRWINSLQDGEDYQ